MVWKLPLDLGLSVERGAVHCANTSLVLPVRSYGQIVDGHRLLDHILERRLIVSAAGICEEELRCRRRDVFELGSNIRAVSRLLVVPIPVRNLGTRDGLTGPDRRNLGLAGGSRTLCGIPRRQPAFSICGSHYERRQASCTFAESGWCCWVWLRGDVVSAQSLIGLFQEAGSCSSANQSIDGAASRRAISRCRAKNWCQHRILYLGRMPKSRPAWHKVLLEMRCKDATTSPGCGTWHRSSAVSGRLRAELNCNPRLIGLRV